METYEKNRNDKEIIERRIIPDRRLADDNIMAGYERRSFRDRRKKRNTIMPHGKGK